MAQDFAKQRQPTGMRRKPVRSATKTASAALTSHWSWFFSGLMAGVILSIAGYLGVLKLESDAAESAQVAQAENPAELPAFDFGFYTDLANAEVTVPGAPVPAVPEGTAVAVPGEAPPANVAPATAATAAAAVPEESPVSYLLQAGSFQNQQDAEAHRARILLLNLSAGVSPGVVSGRTFYRVQVGPFAGRQNAEAARTILSENDIDSIPLLVR